MICVRFAPSPTGNLHIGGARTCLFNWLYARANKGKLILRVEDTDTSRSHKKYLDEILDSLKWLGLEWDDIYFQSQRFDIYKQYADKLLKDDKAYLAENNAVIFSLKPGNIEINDLIHGKIQFDSSTIKDQVLIKADGTPTYNFACVVDDATMNITQVIRGDDHISNSPKQIILYQALGFPVPEFAHLPLILNKGGGRLSKRTGATAISDYRNLGYLPQALINYLLLLSWSPGENRELIDINEAVKLFSINNVNRTQATFDLDKLNWINSQYIRNENPLDLTEKIIPLLLNKSYIRQDNIDKDYIISIVELFQGRMTTLNDFLDRSDFFFVKEIDYQPKAKEKFLSKDLSREFKLLIERLERVEPFEIEKIESEFRQLTKDLDIQTKELVHPVRVALTGKTVGPGLFEIIYYLGKERVKQRLTKWIKKG
jgi:glutamyl-tRNA synthetase